MVWVHASYTKIKSLEDDEECERQGEPFFKPRGLWLGYGDNWIQFATFRKKPKYNYKINFKKDINIITIENINQLKEFHDEYRIHDKAINYTLINWEKVCSLYDGIVFKNYDKIKMESYNLLDTSEKSFKEYLWYHMIDVDCACIFRPSKVISSFSLIND